MTDKVPTREELVVGAKVTWSADAGARLRVSQGIESRIARSTFLGRVLKIGAAGAVVAAVTGSVWLGLHSVQPPSISMRKAAREGARVIAPLSRPATTSDVHGQNVVQSSPQPLTAHARRPAHAAQVVPAEATTAPSVADELSLIREADQALRSNSFELAHELLSRHEREFPHGVLSEEREGLRVIERCSTLQSPLSATLAFDFVARHPRTLLRERIERICGI